MILNLWCLVNHIMSMGVKTILWIPNLLTILTGISMIQMIFLVGLLTKRSIKENTNELKESDLTPFMPLRSEDIENQFKKFTNWVSWLVPKMESQEVYYYASKNCGYFPTHKEQTELMGDTQLSMIRWNDDIITRII